MITKNRILLVLGALIAIMNSIGLPSSYEFFLSIILGLTVVFMAFVYARDRRLTNTIHSSELIAESTTDVYIQNHQAQHDVEVSAESNDEDGFFRIEAIKERTSRFRSPVH